MESYIVCIPKSNILKNLEIDKNSLLGVECSVMCYNSLGATKQAVGGYALFITI